MGGMGCRSSVLYIEGFEEAGSPSRLGRIQVNKARAGPPPLQQPKPEEESGSTWQQVQNGNLRNSFCFSGRNWGLATANRYDLHSS